MPASVEMIHIALPGRVFNPSGRNVDAATVRVVSKSLRVIGLSAGTRIWIAAGVIDMRRGFHRLSAQVQTVLEQQPCRAMCSVSREA